MRRGLKSSTGCADTDCCEGFISVMPRNWSYFVTTAINEQKKENSAHEATVWLCR